MNIQQTLNTNKLKNQYYRGIQLLNSIMIVQNESGKTTSSIQFQNYKKAEYFLWLL